jgi:hypothetical protein
VTEHNSYIAGLVAATAVVTEALKSLFSQHPPARIVVDADLSCGVALFSQLPPARYIDDADLSCGVVLFSQHPPAKHFFKLAGLRAAREHLFTLAGLRAAREHNSYIAGLRAATAVATEALKLAGKRETL